MYKPARWVWQTFGSRDSNYYDFVPQYCAAFICLTESWLGVVLYSYQGPDVSGGLACDSFIIRKLAFMFTRWISMCQPLTQIGKGLSADLGCPCLNPTAEITFCQASMEVSSPGSWDLFPDPFILKSSATRAAVYRSTTLRAMLCFVEIMVPSHCRCSPPRNLWLTRPVFAVLSPLASALLFLPSS